MVATELFTLQTSRFTYKLVDKVEHSIPTISYNVLQRDGIPPSNTAYPQSKTDPIRMFCFLS